jgi:hypothetical protein
MSWNTVERHGQPPVGAWCATGRTVDGRPADLHLITEGVGVEQAAITRWLPPETAVLLDELPEWDDIAPKPMSDKEKRAKRLFESYWHARGKGADWGSEPDWIRSGWVSAQADMLRMCADLISDAAQNKQLNGLGWESARDHLRAKADEEGS